MINPVSAINSIGSNYINRIHKDTETTKPSENKTVSLPFDAKYYNINFTGLSLARDYHKTSQYLSACILEANKTKYGVDGSGISSKNIKDTIDKLFKLNRVYLPFTMAEVSKTKWKQYIPQEVREFSINKVNDARIDRFNTWKSFLENPLDYNHGKGYESLLQEIHEDSCLKFVIWNAINHEIKVNNRHIPVPFDINALAKTIYWFNSIKSENRTLQVPSVKEFLSLYTHKLKDELLMSRPELLMTKKYIPDANTYWVKIPSIKQNKENRFENISALEILSNENWCTRSSVDKAKAALEDGSFYLYLKRDKENPTWQTVLGMTSYKGKIDQIQGANNDNLIPLKELDNIKAFLEQNGLKCISGFSGEGPKATQQIKIAETLKNIDEKTGISLSSAISRKNSYAIFSILGYNPEIEYNSQNIYDNNTNLLTISKYKPSVVLDTVKGIKVSLPYLNIAEDDLLKNVKAIKGDFVLTDTWTSEITHFPENLEKVGGRIICTNEQYSKFKDDMLRVVDNPNKIIIRK